MFNPLELFLLMWAVIGPLKPTVILAAAATSSGATEDEVRPIALRAVVTAASILAAFIVLGEFALDLFKVSIPAFQIGGAIVLLVFALQTIVEDPERAKKEGKGVALSPNIAVYPLAMPLMSSPAVLILIISLVGASDGFLPLIPLAASIAVIMLIDYVFMRNCLRIARVLSPAVMLTLGKIIAILLVGLAVELMFVGLNSWGVITIEGLKASG
ncbi:MarC family protein [Desulfopila sp. IMCC35008]|uniref:MarC family protein n=1 Tax=Desulfopila sp. IMCC35008 TaxID=2653858 RepID=UPI0013D242E6|nr:MarC family protein [Desulfopila sp. IMCC35008]